jgi:hypothetical protein
VQPPRDTPLDTPVTLAQTPTFDPSTWAAQAVVIARTVETLEAAWKAWSELRAWRSLVLRQLTDEQRHLENQGSLLVNAARMVTEPDASNRGLALDPFADARGRLQAAKLALEQQQTQLNTGYDASTALLRTTLLERVQRQAARSPPVVHLAVRVLSPQTRILHLERPTGDEAVLLLFVLNGRIPSRYEYLFDDSTDDLTAEPPSLYPDEGLDVLRPAPPRLRQLLERLPLVWPVKGMLPQVEGGRLFRWRARGPVLEAELGDGEAFRNVLTPGEAELLTAGLLRHQLAGTLRFELSRG